MFHHMLRGTIPVFFLWFTCHIELVHFALDPDVCKLARCAQVVVFAHVVRVTIGNVLLFPPFIPKAPLDLSG